MDAFSAIKTHLSKNEVSFFKKIYLSNGILRLDLLNQKQLKTATFYNTVESLVQKGLVYTTRAEKNAGLGRPPESLWINEKCARIYGIFLTRFEYRFAILDFCGIVLSMKKFTLSAECTQDSFMDDCHRSYTELCAELAVNDADVCGVAVSTVGPLDCVTGVLPKITFSPTRSWSDFRLRERLEAMFQKPVLVDTNANACAYGLAILDYANEGGNLAFFMINEGVGTGLILNSRPFQGWYPPHSPGISHMIIGPGTVRCYCGRYGCLGTLTGTQYVRDYAVDQIKMGKKTTIPHQNVNDITFEDICDYGELGDPFCVSLIESAALAFCIGLNNFLTVVNVPLAILGGRFIERSRLYFDTVKREAAAYAPDLRIEKNTSYIRYAYRGIAAKLVFSMIDDVPK